LGRESARHRPPPRCRPPRLRLCLSAALLCRGSRRRAP